MLNERNEKTKRVIHLMVTTLCKRNCEYCCNKQYDFDLIPYVTDEELKEAEVLCITGGEPFAFTDPTEIAGYYKKKYPNIKIVYAYSNAVELYSFIARNPQAWYDNIDGYTISIKNIADLLRVYALHQDAGSIFKGKSNIIYYFDEDLDPGDLDDFKIIKRDWQEEFKPADDSIFRKV